MSFPSSQEGKTSEIYKTDSTKRHMLGSRRSLPDGRVFHYALAGGSTITIGRVVGHVAQVGAFARDCKETSSIARTTAQWDAGTRSIYVRSTASATTSLQIYANRYDDGYLWINDEAGEGQMLQIKSHNVITSAGSTAALLTIYDEELLTVALSASSQYGLTENLYKDVVIHTGLVAGGIALGVAPIAVAANKYFWLQTWGACAVFCGTETLVAGEEVAVGNATGTTVPGGAVPQDTTEGKRDFMYPRIGYTITPNTGTLEFALVYLTCAP